MTAIPTSLLKTPEAAKYLNVAASHLRALAARGQGPRISARFGRGPWGGNYYTVEDLDAWAEMRRSMTDPRLRLRLETEAA
jgi:hypothetical protein